MRAPSPRPDLQRDMQLDAGRKSRTMAGHVHRTRPAVPMNPRMLLRRELWPWLAAWLLLVLAGVVALLANAWSLQREQFETDGRIAHRLLSQRMAQHDAVLTMLTILQPAAGDPAHPEQMLPAVWPHILRARRVAEDDADPVLRAALAEARTLRHAVLTGIDTTRASYRLVGASGNGGHVLDIDLVGLVPRDEWPYATSAGAGHAGTAPTAANAGKAAGAGNAADAAHPAPLAPTRVTLTWQGRTIVLEPGGATSGPWRFEFHKTLATPSQAFELVATQTPGWGALPWVLMAAWLALSGVAVWAARAMLQQRRARQRAEELLRLGQIARLNTMGELAAGMAHELNQPLTAVLANTQAAQRILDEAAGDAAAAATPGSTDTALADPRLTHALQQAATQAQRAAAVIARLRRTLERPGSDPASDTAVDLGASARHVLDLIEPECRRLGVAPALAGADDHIIVRADAVALEQIVHNLVTNALQALEQTEPGRRELVLTVSQQNGQGVLEVRDSGPGFAAEVLPRVFEPFFTTRQNGLGLGLNLCETLALNMGGQVSAANAARRGALVALRLPLAATAEAS